MDLSLERDGSVLGSLFNQIIADMKNTSPLWEDFVAKASKLHACLRAAIQAIAAYLDAFQKIADAATNSRGATKEIGTALTRVCLRHKAVETRLKTFTTAIMDCLVLPLQDKLEDWKRSVATIDKEHAKEHKRCRAELKKRSNDTLRLQKKARKGQSDTIQSLVDSHMQDVTLRRVELEEVEKKSLRSAMIEERMRYCTFVHMLQPVVKEECEVMSELGHLQEAMQSIALVTKEPSVLPQASEELILDVKSSMSLYPESPGGGSGSQGGCSNSLGSRKSSVCSISSMNSSGSSGSPGHHHYQRSLSQFVSPAIRLKPGESSDSGFCSSPALTSQVSTATSQTHAVSTWPPHSQDVVATPTADRPHTISTAYEKGHQRPPLTVYTFQNPETIMEAGGAGGGSTGSISGQTTPSTQKSPASALSRPPLPVRCSSLERPLSANNNRNGGAALMQRQCPSPIPAHITKELSAVHHTQQQQHQQQLQLQQSPPTYVNMSELATMAAMKATNQQQQQQLQQLQQLQQQQQATPPPPPPPLQQQQSTDSHSSISSLISNDSLTNPQQNHSTATTVTTNTNTPRSHHSNHSQSSSSATPSLHSHPSIDSTVATPLIGQTPTPSSGCSTPQNHYSPLLTNSPSSTAAGTPSGGSCGHGVGGFVCNINSPTPPQSGTGNCTPSSTASGAAAAAGDILKITETDSTKNTTSNDASTNNADQNSSSNTNTDSPTIVENDERSRASVLQKASMFEKQAAAVSNSTPPPPSNMVRNNSAVDIGGGGGTNAIYGQRRIEDYRAPTPLQQHTEYAAPDKDVDKSFEDSIQELNNLIGELDSFQREIDEGKQQQQQQQQQQPQQQRSSNTTSSQQNGSLPPTASTIITTTATLTEAATTLLTYQQQQQQQQSQPTTPAALQYCATTTTSSNQTNSSGCGTDISDTTSDELAALASADKISIASLNYMHTHSNKNICNYNSDSELGSRCYMSETSSLISGANDGGDGYENPTFVHFADSRSLLTVDDGMSQTSETLSTTTQQQHRHIDFIDNGGSDDGGSAVVVIYDHQIPMTPDIDYVKKNSEIVVLRTKDPQQTHHHHHQHQEMRELQQLPSNFGALDGGSDANNMPLAATATVAPINQRLSSFRASSEQQLQLLSGSNNNIYQQHHQQQQQHQHSQKGTQRLSTDSRNSLKLPVATASSVEATTCSTSTTTTTTTAENILRRKLLPPKPSLSIFNVSNGNNNNNNAKNNNSKNKLPQQQLPQLPVATKADFKADLDAKIRKQKQKLLLKEQQQQQQQNKPNNPLPKQQQQQSPSVTNNCNTNKYCSALPLPPAATTAIPTSITYSSSSSSIATSLTNGSNCSASTPSITLPATTLSLPPQQHLQHNGIISNHALPSPPLPSPPPPLTPQSPLYNDTQPIHIHLQQQQHNLHLPLPPKSTTIKTKTITTSSPYSSSSATNSTTTSTLSSLTPSPSACVSAAASFPTTPPLPPNPATTTTIISCSTSMPATYPPPSPSALLVSSSSLTSPSSSSSYQTSSTSSSPVVASAAKPNISPRPASLSGGTTRIARRSSVNTAKPPPPVRRSSSVTPSHNVSTGQQQHSSSSAATTTNLLQQQQQQAMNHSIESLPPPPAYLLERQAHKTPTSPLIPAVNGMPASSLKVAETVKALSALRHQPASPGALRRAQLGSNNNHQQQHVQQPHYQQQQVLQQLQQQHQQKTSTLQSPSSHSHIYATSSKALSNNSNSNSSSSAKLQEAQPDDYDAYYNPYVEVHQTAAYNSSTATPSSNTSAFSTPVATPTNSDRMPHFYQQQQLQHQQQFYAASLPSPPPPLPVAVSHDHATGPPPLPPPNPIRHQTQQHYNQTYHHLSSQDYAHSQQSIAAHSSDSNNIYGNQSSFRTSSPGIYAQPKIVSNMSSFRTSSPGANNGHQLHQPQAQLPAAAQPKTNPNLIAQLNARLSKQQQQPADQAIYGSSPISPNHQQQQQQQQINEAIYMRNFAGHQQHQPQHQQQQQQQQQQHVQQQQQQQHYQQQQHNHDDYATSTNLDKNIVVGCSSIRSKTKAEFLENLNAKLAKQGISGRAFAVRNLINSKALPDPRLCHESLMDQIKRGATLKRNQKINDRSAPKIH